MKIRNILAFVVCAALLAVAGYALAQDAESEREAEQIRQEAREAINQKHYEEAAHMLAEVYELQKQYEDAGNDLYWQAYARYTMRRTEELKIAAELLRLQQERYREAETLQEGEALLARLNAELAERGDVDAAREIHEMSEDEMRREEARVAALESLMRMNPDKAMPILEDIVTGKKEASPEFRRHAVFILCRDDSEGSEDALIEMMQTTEDPELLSELIMCLSMKESDRALDAIVDLFEKSDDPQVDEAAMFAIGRHGGDRAFAMLAGIARDPEADTEMRARALFSLGHTGRDDEVADIAVDIIRNETDREMLEMSLMTLSRLEGDVPDQVFMDLINNPAADEGLRTQALYFAARRDQLDLAFLKEIYAKAESRDMKLQICHVITRMDDEEASLDALIEIIRTEDDLEIKQEAVFWISRYDSERAAEFLLEVINEE